MQTKHLCVLIHIRMRGKVSMVKICLSFPVNFLLSKVVLYYGSLLLFVFDFGFYDVCFVALWSSVGKWLGSWLSCK